MDPTSAKKCEIIKQQHSIKLVINMLPSWDYLLGKSPDPNLNFHSDLFLSSNIWCQGHCVHMGCSYTVSLA